MAAAIRAAWSLWTEPHVTNLLGGVEGPSRTATALRYAPACDLREEARPAACSCRCFSVLCAAADSTPGACELRAERRPFALNMLVLTMQFFPPLSIQSRLLHGRC